MILDKKELEHSIHLLEGLLKGIAFDKRINEKEIDEINHWIATHEVFREHYPYTVLIPLLSSVLVDGIITEEEKQDVLWFCNKISTDNLLFDMVASDLQRLQGILHGILSDKIIRDEEVHSLNAWLRDNHHLKSYYPYDELVGVINNILADKQISSEERQLLERYFIEFVGASDMSSYDETDIKQLKDRISLNAVCAIEPEIIVNGKQFAITGQLSQREKKQFIEKINAHSGTYCTRVHPELNYLIVCDDSALLWAFEPYGRKIDQVLALRSQGHPIVIVKKRDFISALSSL
ncbi:MAG: hypothetical protein JXO44_10420 [Clostridia bacterium]|nr:hypothetical protein [Clostridia bacterium]